MIAARQVGAAATVEEQGVAGHELAVDEEALAAGGVSRCVDEFDLDVAHPDDVAGVVADQLIGVDPGGAGDPGFFVALDVDRARHAFEQSGDPVDVEPHHRPADVVGVVVRGQHARHGHAVGSHRVDQAGGIVRRVDEHALTRGPVAHCVHEVDHLLGELVVGREVATREQLAEVQTIVVGLGHAVSVRCTAMSGVTR